MGNNGALVEKHFEPLPLGSIKPSGWLENQLKIQADMTARLDEFWPWVGDSAWFGRGGDGWERAPYWLDGAVPLAFLLDDELLKIKVREYVDYIITHQQPDGWIGPVDPAQVDEGTFNYDPWPTFVALKVLTQYQEATGDQRVIEPMLKHCRRLEQLLSTQSLGSWGMFRWQDLVVSIHWLYDRTGEEWLLTLAQTAHDQGYDWYGHFKDFKFKEKVPAAEQNLATHVVNNAMGVKTAGIWYRQTGSSEDRAAVDRCLKVLDQYHGTVVGTFTGDEHFAGTSPSQGTELCAVVEYMYSLENLIAILGDVKYADRLEKIAFNALPAQFTPDMWSHQYDQQVNQVLCKFSDDHPWETNGPDANLFGLEPNYGCCTANYHQGWPKFVSHLWMKTKDNGLAAVSYGPNLLSTTIDGVKVEIELITDYPFDDELNFIVRTSRAITFPLYLRIPSWAEGATVISGNNKKAATAGTFHRLEREWTGNCEVSLSLPMEVKPARHFNDAVHVARGPLVYALPVDAQYKPVRGILPNTDWELYPMSSWNYALQVDWNVPENSFKFSENEVGNCPYSPDGAPVVCLAKGKIVKEWSLEHNAAAPVLQSPVEGEGELVQLKLIPYGCTMLRVTEFPVLK